MTSLLINVCMLLSVLLPDSINLSHCLIRNGMMQVVPAQYAFVVHTANPISKQRGETFGEVVMGMGEALVGNYPGRALSFSAAPGQEVCNDGQTSVTSRPGMHH